MLEEEIIEIDDQAQYPNIQERHILLDANNSIVEIEGENEEAQNTLFSFMEKEVMP